MPLSAHHSVILLVLIQTRESDVLREETLEESAALTTIVVHMSRICIFLQRCGFQYGKQVVHRS